MDASRIQFYDKRDYLATLARRFRAATSSSRILLMSMTLDADIPEVTAVLEALETAGRKGARIWLGIDARSFLDANGQHATKPSPLWLRKTIPRQLQPPYTSKMDWLNRLAQHEHTHVNVTNLPAHRLSLPIAGRSHIKAALIDTEIILGSCNLDGPDYIEQALGWHSPRAADQLFELLRPAIETGNVRSALHDQDQHISLSEHSGILVDAGVPGQSRILQQALTLIDSAQDWLTLTCQFFPNDITLKHLQRARERGVDVRVIYSNLSKFSGFAKTLQVTNRTIERLRVPPTMFAGELGAEQPYMHAKTLACDKGLMIGSHNYVSIGVRLGTAEITYYSADAALAEQAASLLLRQL